MPGIAIVPRMYEYKVMRFHGTEELENELNVQAKNGLRFVQVVTNASSTFLVFESEKISLKSDSTI